MSTLEISQYDGRNIDRLFDAADRLVRKYMQCQACVNGEQCGKTSLLGGKFCAEHELAQAEL